MSLLALPQNLPISRLQDVIFTKEILELVINEDFLSKFINKQNKLEDLNLEGIELSDVTTIKILEACSRTGSLMRITANLGLNQSFLQNEENLDILCHCIIS